MMSFKEATNAATENKGISYRFDMGYGKTAFAWWNTDLGKVSYTEER